MSNYVKSCKVSPVTDVLVWPLVQRQIRSSTGFTGTVAKTLKLWSNRYRQRQMLATLSPRLLKDIDVTPAQQAEESTKPFWVE